ncbi:MAG: aconitate hydratase AcnA, partial [Micromonosporaceae bacterium]
VKSAFRAQHPGAAGHGDGIGHGTVAIAAITSCTNTSNPSVMVAAGLLARNAVERGLRTRPWVKTTLSPGSRVVMDYYARSGLTPYLERLGFNLAGFGCMTCIGASGPLVGEVSRAVREHDLDVAAVLSGNRNFDGRVQPEVRSNYLASPPLVVAYALAGTVDRDLTSEPLGTDLAGLPVYLRDIWPSAEEVRDVIEDVIRPEMFARAYADVFDGDDRWRGLGVDGSPTFGWESGSTYVRRVPYLDGLPAEPAGPRVIEGARVLAVLGDFITTDHISPAGAIPADSAAGRYLTGLGVPRAELNTYASRRGNHEVMMRGTFANVRLRNLLVPGTEGGFTANLLDGGALTPVYEAANAYTTAGVPTVVLAGEGYGAGSSRDWAAKGPALLGVAAVIAKSFERIHRSNLAGMGVLPLEFLPGEGIDELGLTGHESITISGLEPLADGRIPRTVTVTADGTVFSAVLRLDTPREAAYHVHGGILPYVLRTLLRP